MILAQERVVVRPPNQIGGLTVGESTYDDTVDLYGRPDDRDRRKTLTYATYEGLGLRAVVRRAEPETPVIATLTGEYIEEVPNGLRSDMSAAEGEGAGSDHGK